MNAHQLDASGVIINTIIVNSLEDLPDLVDASIGGQAGDSIVDGKLVPAVPVVEVPEEISPRQFRQALNKFGFRQQVDNAVAASTDQNLKDWYAYTSAFERHHPEVLTMATALGFTADQLDQVWIYGAAL
jgi:hypothetical protein